MLLDTVIWKSVIIVAIQQYYQQYFKIHLHTESVGFMASRQTCIKCQGTLKAVKFNGKSWWRHQMETFSALLAICAGNSPGTQRPVTQSFDVYFDLRPNKRLSKQSWDRWLETLSPHYDVIVMTVCVK